MLLLLDYCGLDLWIRFDRCFDKSLGNFIRSDEYQHCKLRAVDVVQIFTAHSTMFAEQVIVQYTRIGSVSCAVFRDSRTG